MQYDGNILEFLLQAIRRPIVPVDQWLSVSIVLGWCAASVAHLPYAASPLRQLSPRDYNSLGDFIGINVFGLAIGLSIARGWVYYQGIRSPISLMGPGVATTLGPF